MSGGESPTDIAAQKAQEALSKGLSSLANPECFDAEAAAVDTVKTVIKAVPVLIGVNTVSGGILYKVIDKVISVETLRAVKENPDIVTVVTKLVLNDDEIKALTKKLPSLEGFKNLAGNIPGASAVGGVASKVTGGIGSLNPWGRKTDGTVPKTP